MQSNVFFQYSNRFLAPYDFQYHKKWQQLTNEINEEVILRD